MAEAGAWMPMYWADYLGDTMHLSTEHHGAYLLLIATYWRRGKALPDDDRFLANATRMSTKKWKMVRPIVSDFFEILDGEWTHKRVEYELDRSCARSAAASANAKRRQCSRARLPQSQESSLRSDSDSSSSASARRSLDVEFAEFWQLYPSKVGKKPARLRFEHARRTHSLAAILDGLQRYTRTKPPDRSWLHPATFLHQERFNDEPEPLPKPNGANHGRQSANQPASAVDAALWVIERLDHRSGADEDEAHGPLREID